MLPTPDLDDRRFDDLVEEASRLIKRRCPEWTDHNPSDPGVTLVEAFAFMMDRMLYRLNQVPDRLYARFLDLVGVRMLPPAAARVPVTFWSTTPVTDAPLTVHRGTTVATVHTESEQAVGFLTDEDVQMVPTRLASLLTQACDDEAPRSHNHGPHGPAAPFPSFGEPPRAGDGMLLGLENAVERCAVQIDFDGRVDGVGVVPGAPPLVWEAWTGSAWTACEVSLDETGGLNRPGRIVVHVPAGHTPSVQAGTMAGWLRVRITEPDGRSPAYTSSPVVHGISAATIGATVTATQVETVAMEVLGEAEGVPGQRFLLSDRPLPSSPADPVVETASQPTGGEWQTWTRVEHFAASGPEDRHYVLDPVAGEVLFGPAVRYPDGSLRRHGATPPSGAVVRIRDFAVGGGARGNVGAGTLRSLTSSLPFVAGVENRQPARGGADGETLEEAVARAPLMLRSISRAVTAEDFETIALEAAPELARTRCLPDGQVPGAVRVFVVPAGDGGRSGRGPSLERLVPTEDTLKRVARRLDKVRLVGTTVMVEPPLYRGVTVVARVTPHRRADTERVRADVEGALNRYLDPLPGGGPDGTGWPFGRPVLVGEIFALLQRVQDVDLVADVRLFAANPVTGERGQQTSRIDIAPNSLVISYDHQIHVEGER